MVAIFILFLTVIFLPRPTHASWIYDFWKYFSGENSNAAENSSFAMISAPLLGSQNTPPPAAGMGGPTGDCDISLSTTQDNALIGSRNPTGILPDCNQGEIVIYTVMKADTPSSIAEKFGISLNTLLWANNIRNSNLIKVGDELIILPVSGVKYEVKKGDTIESIAKLFKPKGKDTDLSDFISDIISFNGLAINESLEVGSIIIIPDGELTLPAAPGVRTPRFTGLPEYRGYYMRPIFGGRKTQGIHGYNGVDLANPCGSPILASAPGTVIITRPSGWNGGYGRYLVLTHPNGTQTLYAHIGNILARVGQTIAQGSQIATVGDTGNSTGCHVHFEIRGARNPF